MISRRSGPLALAPAIAAIALAGCGGSSGIGESGAGVGAGDVQGVGRVSGGSTATFADCKAWRRGTVLERYATIAEIRGEPEADLADDDAYKILDKICASSFSDSLRLYKLYARAEAFAPLGDNPLAGAPQAADSGE